MEIKNGFKMVNGPACWDILPFIKNRVGPVILEAHDDILREYLVSFTVGLLELYNNTGINLMKECGSSENKLIAAAQLLGNKVEAFKRLGARCSVYMYPLFDKTLFIVKSGNPAYAKRFGQIHGIEEYNYTNSLEVPSGMASIEWEKRRHDWNSDLKYSEDLRGSALAFDIISESEYMDESRFFKKFNECIPSDSKRIQMLKEILDDMGENSNLQIKLLPIAEDTFKRSFKSIFGV